MAETEIKSINGKTLADASARKNKLDKNQGTENAGKILGIGADGNITPQNKPAQALAGASAPTTTTAGVVGQEYYVIVGNAVTEMYVCTAVANGTYTWGNLEFGAEIDDTSTEPTKVWSAEKCNQLSEAIAEKTENATVYDLDCVREIVGENLWTEGDLEVDYNGTSKWLFTSKGMVLPAGTYTLVLPNVRLSAINGMVCIEDENGEGDLYHTNIKKNGTYLFRIPDDETYSGTLYIRMQVSKATAEEAGLYYVRGIRLYKGDVRRDIILKKLTGVDGLTETVVASRNLLNLDTMTYGKYITEAGAIGSNSNYDLTDYIPVNPGDTVRCQFNIGGSGRYDMTQRAGENMSYLSAFDSNKEHVSGARDVKSYVVPDGVAYIRITLMAKYHDPSTNYKYFAIIISDSADIVPYDEYHEETLVKLDFLPIDDNKVANNKLWSSERITKEFQNNRRSNKIISIDDTVQALETSVTLTVPQLKKNKTIAFSGIYTGELTELSIVQGEGSGFTEVKCVVTDTSVTIIKNNAEVYTAEHGLTFDTHFSLVLATTNNNKTKVYLASGGNNFTSAEFVFLSSRSTLTLHTNVPFTHYQFSFGSNDFDKKIWMYGDSYFDHWLPLSISRGYTNCLTDGYSGGSSAAARASFELAIQHGTPSTVVWCLGMNNGDNAAINQSWLDCITAVKEICDSKGIDLWVTTIPNTPTIDNSYKNAYIRENFQYIDICKFVGAEESTAWYDGLLSTDNIHPSAKGDYYIANIMESYFPEMLEA